MKFTPTGIHGVYLIEIEPIPNKRGFFSQTFCTDEFQRRGLVEIRMRTGDALGTKAALEQLVKLNPTNKQYKEFLAALNKQVTDTKNVGTLKPTEPKQPTPPSK